MSKQDKIRRIALDLLSSRKEGMRYSELVETIHTADSSFNQNTIRGAIWDLDVQYSTGSLQSR